MPDTHIWYGGDTGNENDWDTDANWSGGAKPANDDTVIIMGGAGPGGVDYDITDGLNQTALDLTAVIIMQSFSGEIGTASSPLILGARAAGTTITIGQHDGTGTPSGSPLIHIQLDGDADTDVYIDDSAVSPSTANTFPIHLLGGTDGSTLTVRRGRVGVATGDRTETATLDTLVMGYRTNVESDAEVVLGVGVTIENIHKAGGSLIHQSAASTEIVNRAGRYEKLGAGTVALLTNYDGNAILGGLGGVTIANQAGRGTMAVNTTGGVGTLNAQLGSVRTTDSAAAKTIATTNLSPGATLTCNTDAVTFTNKIDLVLLSGPMKVTIGQI